MRGLWIGLSQSVRETMKRPAPPDIPDNSLSGALSTRSRGIDPVSDRAWAAVFGWPEITRKPVRLGGNSPEA